MQHHYKKSIAAVSVLFLVGYNYSFAAQLSFQKKLGIVSCVQDWVCKNPRKAAGIVVLSGVVAGVAKIKYDRLKKIPIPPVQPGEIGIEQADPVVVQHEVFDPAFSVEIPAEKQEEINKVAKVATQEFKVAIDTEYVTALDEFYAAEDAANLAQKEFDAACRTPEQLRFGQREASDNFRAKLSVLELKQVELAKAKEKLQTIVQAAESKRVKALEQVKILQEALGMPQDTNALLVDGCQVSAASMQYQKAMVGLHSALYVLEQRKLVAVGGCPVCFEDDGQPMPQAYAHFCNQVCLICCFNAALNQTESEHPLIRGYLNQTSWQQIVVEVVSYKPIEK